MAKTVDFEKMIDKRANRGRFERFIKRLNGIQLGNDSSKGKHPEYVVRLNSTNSGIIESQIEDDENYIPFTEMVIKHLKQDNNGVFDWSNRKTVLAVVRIIDVVNSTNVWRFNRNGLKQMVDYICQEGDAFCSKLFNSNEKIRCELVDTLVEKSNIQGGEELDEEPQPRSLASKICKYLAEYLDPNSETKENWYFINDSFVRKTLPFYCKYYGVDLKRGPGDDYGSLFDALEGLRKEAAKAEREEGHPLTRSKMDHLMWYCYKNSGNTDEFQPDLPQKSLSDSKLKDLLSAFVNLYGAIGFDKAVGIILKHYPSCTQDALTARFKKLSLERPINFSVIPVDNKNYLALPETQADKIETLLERLGQKELYEPGNFAKYVNDGCRYKWVNKLIESLKNKDLLQAEDDIDSFVESFHRKAYVTFDQITSDTVTNLFFENIHCDDQKNANKIRTAIKQAFASVRLPINGGHFPS